MKRTRGCPAQADGRVSDQEARDFQDAKLGRLKRPGIQTGAMRWQSGGRARRGGEEKRGREVGHGVVVRCRLGRMMSR